MGMQWSMGKKMMKEEMENSNVIMCWFWQIPWQEERQEEYKEERKVHHKPLCHTCQMCDYHTGGHPNCLAVSTAKRLQGRKRTVSMVLSWNTTVSVVKRHEKHKEEKKVHQKTSRPYMLNVWLSYQRSSKMSCSICSEQAEGRKKNSIHDAELKKNSTHGAKLKQNSIHGAELEKEDKKIRWWKMNSLLPIWQRRQEARWWKMNFLLPIWKRRQNSH